MVYATFQNLQPIIFILSITLLVTVGIYIYYTTIYLYYKNTSLYKYLWNKTLKTTIISLHTLKIYVYNYFTNEVFASKDYIIWLEYNKKYTDVTIVKINELKFIIYLIYFSNLFNFQRFKYNQNQRYLWHMEYDFMIFIIIFVSFLNSLFTAR